MLLCGSDVGGGGGGHREAVVESDVGGVIWLWLAVEAIVVVVMVAWLALWLFGSDVGGGGGGRREAVVERRWWW